MSISSKVRKGVITVAGLGTRFLPATKAMPKEMLPILDKPVLQYIVEEMVESGIQEILFVTSAQKQAIEDHFDRNLHFEQMLETRGKLDALKPLIALHDRVRFFYTRQASPKGNGDALRCAREFVGDEPFAFSDGDSIIDGDIPVVAQLIKIFEIHNQSVVGVQRLDDKEAMTCYGNVYASPFEKAERVYAVQALKEKPHIDAISPLGLIIGGMRYIFTSDIWPILAQQAEGKDGEIWLADAVNALAKENTVLAYEYDGQYFDTGNKAAMLRTILHFAEKSADTADVLKTYINR